MLRRRAVRLDRGAAGRIVDHAAAHRNADVDDLVGEIDLPQGVQGAGRQGEIDRAPGRS